MKLSEKQIEMLEAAAAKELGRAPGFSYQLEGAEFRTRDSLIERGLVKESLAQHPKPGGYDANPHYRIIATEEGRRVLEEIKAARRVRGRADG